MFLSPPQIDRGKAEKATRSIFWLVDRRSAIDPFSGEREALAEEAAVVADGRGGGVGGVSPYYRPMSNSVTSLGSATSTGEQQTLFQWLLEEKFPACK